MRQPRCQSAEGARAQLRVLVVDDSTVMRSLIAASVEAAGGTVIGQAADGEEGLERFKSLRPDLVLLDVTMPNRDGRECLREIIQTDSTSRVVMLSALANPEVVDECKGLGAMDFISKSLTSNRPEFEERLRGIMDVIQAKAA